MGGFFKHETLKHYETEISTIKKELRGLPAGALVIRGTYYCVKDGSSERGITRDREKVRQLARKAYLSQRLKNLEWNYSLIITPFQLFKTEDPMEIIAGLSSACRSLPLHCFFHPSVQQLQESPFSSDASHSDGLIYLTDSGLRVRSKSERTIANLLDCFDVPYRYEAALTLGGKVRYPDFTIFRPFDGKLFLWEHFGLMDNEDYRKKVSEKLALYAQGGFFPFDRLICTYEHDLHDPSRIEMLIKAFLFK